MDFQKINYKKVKKFLSWTTIGSLFAVLIFVLLPLLPIENNYSLKMVLSGSMSPTIKTGAIVIIKPASGYQVGDMVTYKYGTRARDLTTHRIVGQEGDEFITKGDNNNAADIYPIKKEQIIGKVIFGVPYAGYVANFLHSKFGIILLILIPALLIIGSEGLKIFKEVKKMRQKNRKTKEIRAKISVFLILFLFLPMFSFTYTTNAYFSDSIISENNLFQAGVLDMTLRSGQNNFVSGADNMQPGQQVNRDIYVGKTASSFPLQYKMSYELISGDSELCDQLDLKIWYNHYSCQGTYGDCRDMRLKYNGKLSDLTNLVKSDFEIPHPDDQFDIDDSNGTEQWFFYSIIVPNNIANDLEGKLCHFNFVFDAWQENMLNYGDGGFTDKEKIESTITIGSLAPILNPIGDKPGTEGEMLQFPVTATDPNGDTLIYSASNLPTGANFDPGTQAFSWTPTSEQAGTYSNIIFEVSDGTYTDSENITITIDSSSPPGSLI